MLTKRDKKEVEGLRKKIFDRLSKEVPSPAEAQRLGWKILFDPDGEEVVGYLKPNGDIVFVDGTRVRNRAVEVDSPDDVDEG